jgi:hypothetical protein
MNKRVCAGRKKSLKTRGSRIVGGRLDKHVIRRVFHNETSICAFVKANTQLLKQDEGQACDECAACGTEYVMPTMPFADQ